MVCVGIDVAKDKHDCLSSVQKMKSLRMYSPSRTAKRDLKPCCKIKVGLEATRHYSYNILRFLLDNGLPTYVITPLHTKLYRKSLSLRKIKTDRIMHERLQRCLCLSSTRKTGANLTFSICLCTSQRSSGGKPRCRRPSDTVDKSA
jgi:transposase